MRFGFIVAACAIAAPANAAVVKTVYQGTAVADTNGFADLTLVLPAPIAGERFRFTFAYSGGMADGGEILWRTNSYQDEILPDGNLLRRGVSNDTGCNFRAASIPARCFSGAGYQPFASFQFTEYPGFLSLDFLSDAGPGGTCEPADPVGVCATGTSFGPGRLTAFFVGDTDYKITLISGVPEPTTWALMILGFAGIGGAMRRKTIVQPHRLLPSHH